MPKNDIVSELLMHKSTAEIQDDLQQGISLEQQYQEVLRSSGQTGSNQSAERTSIQNMLQHLRPESEYPWNDQGIGKLFADVFKNEARFNVTAKEWYTYTGKIWEEDTGGMHVAQKAKLLADALLIYCTTIEDELQRTSYTKFVTQYGRYHNRKTMVDDARSEYFVSQNDFDRDGKLFNCQNGVLDLEAFQLLPHSPDYLLSKISNVVFDPDARSPRFERFIDEVMLSDKDKITYLQKTLGLALTVDTSLETCWIWYGATTRNGKGTLAETISYMMGNTAGYALAMSPETLAQRKTKDTRQASGDIARLNGCRFLNASEPPKRMLFDAALLKTLLGRDTITARHLYEREFEFVPQFKLFVNTNFLPLIQDDTLFSSGRINVLCFDRHFEPNEQDNTLKETLRKQKNISGIFNWCLDGLRLYRETGLTPPQSVRDATRAYRENSDKTQNFIDDCLEQTGNNVGAGTVYQRYATWCNENGFGTESKRSFFDELKNKGLFAPSATVNGKTVRNVVIGYELIDDEPPLPDPPPYWKQY